MWKNAAFIFEVKRLEPRVKAELSQALEEMLLQKERGLFRVLKGKTIHKQADRLSNRMIRQSALEHRQCGGSKALQFFESEIRLANDTVFYYQQLDMIVHTLHLIFLVVGEQYIVFEHDTSIKGTPAALLKFLEDKTGLHVIYA